MFVVFILRLNVFLIQKAAPEHPTSDPSLSREQKISFIGGQTERYFNAIKSQAGDGRERRAREVSVCSLLKRRVL